MPRNTILLRGHAREESGIASEALTPGMLVEYGGSDDFQAHGTQGGPAALMFVREQWEHDGADIDDDITSGDEITVLFVEVGAKVNAVANGTIQKGDFLASDGNGALQVAESGDAILAVAADDNDGTRVAAVVGVFGPAV